MKRNGILSDKVYGDGRLFHGPDFQCIEALEVCNPTNAAALVRSAPAPKQMIAQPLRPAWLADPLALDAALPIAKANAAELRLLNIQPIVPVSMIDYIPPNFDDELRQTAEKELAEMIGHVDYPSAQRSSTVRFGAVYPEVLAEADDWGADLIVVGADVDDAGPAPHLDAGQRRRAGKESPGPPQPSGRAWPPDPSSGR